MSVSRAMLLSLGISLAGKVPVEAYRPFVSTDAAVAGVRELEIELGFVRTVLAALVVLRSSFVCLTRFRGKNPVVSGENPHVSGRVEVLDDFGNRMATLA